MDSEKACVESNAQPARVTGDELRSLQRLTGIIEGTETWHRESRATAVAAPPEGIVHTYIVRSTCTGGVLGKAMPGQVVGRVDVVISASGVGVLERRAALFGCGLGTVDCRRTAGGLQVDCRWTRKRASEQASCAGQGWGRCRADNGPSLRHRDTDSATPRQLRHPFLLPRLCLLPAGAWVLGGWCSVGGAQWVVLSAWCSVVVRVQPWCAS